MANRWNWFVFVVFQWNPFLCPFRRFTAGVRTEGSEPQKSCFERSVLCINSSSALRNQTHVLCVNWRHSRAQVKSSQVSLDSHLSYSDFIWSQSWTLLMFSLLDISDEIDISNELFSFTLVLCDFISGGEDCEICRMNRAFNRRKGKRMSAGLMWMRLNMMLWINVVMGFVSTLIIYSRWTCFISIFYFYEYLSHKCDLKLR